MDLVLLSADNKTCVIACAGSGRGSLTRCVNRRSFTTEDCGQMPVATPLVCDCLPHFSAAGRLR